MLRNNLARISVVGSLTLVLATATACGSDGSDNESDARESTTSTTPPGDEAHPQPTKTSSPGDSGELSDAYADILDAAPAGSQYALVDITADGDPELLVRVPDVNKDRNDVLSVSVYATDGTKARIPGLQDEVFPDGAASAGGGRYQLQASVDNDGLLFSSWTSTSPEMTTELWTLGDGEMNKTEQSWRYPTAGVDGSTARPPADLADKSVDIDWKPLPGAKGATTGGVPDGSGDTTSRRSKADYPNFSAGTTNSGQIQTTSDQFARAVYNAWIDQYIATGNLNAVVTATSEATGKTYDMKCSLMDPNIICTGGNNASVLIYPPSPDPSTLPHGVQWG